MTTRYRSPYTRATLVFASLASLASLASGPSMAAAAPPKPVPDSIAFPQSKAPIPIEPGDPQLGKRDALLTLVVFADYNPLPYRYFRVEDEIAKLRAHYGDELRVVFKDLPQAMFADAALRGAAAHGAYELGGEAAFVKFIGNVGLFPGTIDEATLAGFAVVAGIDKARFEAGLRAGKWLEAVKKSEQLASVTLNLLAVPVFYLNGWRYDGMQKPEDLYAGFDRELANCKSELTRGLTARDVYALRTKQNFGRLLLDEQRARAQAEQEWLVQRAPKVVPGVSIGKIRLGMSLDEVAALPGVRVNRWTNERALIAPSPTSDYSPFLVFTRDGVIERIQYKVSGDGVTIRNKTFPKTATFDEIRSAVGCGPIEPAAAGVLVSCPGGVTLVKENTGCVRFIRDTPRTPCTNEGRPGSESYAVNVEIAR